MPQYIVRIELHGADSKDYDQLHNLMQEGGYSREITDGAGSAFHLPTAEYTIIRQSSSGVIRDNAKAIAVRVKPSFDILATEVSDISWWLTKKK